MISNWARAFFTYCSLSLTHAFGIVSHVALRLFPHEGVSQSKPCNCSILLYSSPNSVMMNIKLETQRLRKDERRKHLITELVVFKMANKTPKLTSTTSLYKKTTEDQETKASNEKSPINDGRNLSINKTTGKNGGIRRRKKEPIPSIINL